MGWDRIIHPDDFAGTQAVTARTAGRRPAGVGVPHPLPGRPDALAAEPLPAPAGRRGRRGGRRPRGSARRRLPGRHGPEAGRGGAAQERAGPTVRHRRGTRLGTFYCNWPFDKIVWNDTCNAHFFQPPDADVDFDLFYSLLHPDDREPTRRAIDRAIEERVEYNVEYRVVGPEGQMRWINAVGRADYTPSGVPARFDGITIDVTERKASERELSEAFEREALVNRIGQAIRQAQDPEALLQTAVALLGRALNADRCYYVTYDLEESRSALGPDWQRDRAGLPSRASTTRMITASTTTRATCLGETHVVEDTHALINPDAADRVGLRSLVRAPLAPGPIMTALAVAMSDRPRVWTQNEVRLVEAVASQTQAALEVARMQQREHRIATALQDALQPPVPADVPRLNAIAFTRPALDEAKIGGDFYDVFPLDKRAVRRSSSVTSPAKAWRLPPSSPPSGTCCAASCTSTGRPRPL